MDFTVNSQQVFPAGVTVKAYLRSNWQHSQIPPEGAPKGASVAEAVVDASGNAVLKGLAEGTKYFAGAEVSAGVWRYVRIYTAKKAAASLTSGEVEALVATAVGTEKTRAELAEGINRATAEGIARIGLPEKWWWGLTFPFTYTTVVPAAASLNVVRFVPEKDMTLRGLSCITTVAATANDNCAVGVLDGELKTLLASSGSVPGKMNAAHGRQDIDFAADVALKANVPVYLAFQYGALGGTAATLAAFSVLAGGDVAQVIGAAVPNLIMASGTSTFPFGTVPPTAITVQVARTILIARER